MTVQLCGSSDDPEYEWAKKVKESFEKDDQLKNNPNNKILIMPSIQCYGQRTQDIDIVVMGLLEKYKTKVNTSIYNETNNPQIRETIIANFCCVIEVKKHNAEYIEIKDTKVYVTTNNKKKGVTIQNRDQKYSLIHFLEKDIKDKPWVSNIIFFPKCRRDNLGKIPMMNLLFKEFELKDFWELILSQRPPRRNYSGELSYSANLSRDSFETCRNLLTTPFKTTKLDRKKVDEICKDIIKEQKYGEKLGTQLLIFRGRGGTGKTFRLLNLAYKLYNENLDRVLILTYNHALIADIQRLFTILKIRDGIDESIQIKTLHSFWFSLFHKIGIRTKEDMNYKNNYKISNELIDKARQFIKANPRKIIEISMDFPNLLCWDYVMVDEAQDWPKEERDLLYALFPPENIMIADGYDQLIRTGKGCNWRGTPIVKNCQAVNLTKSMRQKSNIVGFLKEFAKRMNIDNFDIEEQDSLHGGKIIIVEGEYTQKFHQELVKNNREDKNENIDMLFCVPPSNVDKSTNNSLLSLKFRKWGFQVWDAVNEKTKSSYPTDVNQLRVVQYDSCRGLEGWISVNLEFDKFYNYKLETIKEHKGQLDLRSPEERRKDFAAKWLLIPLTRAIDTLVLNIRDPNSHISKILKEITENNPEYNIQLIQT